MNKRVPDYNSLKPNEQNAENDVIPPNPGEAVTQTVCGKKYELDQPDPDELLNDEQAMKILKVNLQRLRDHTTRAYANKPYSRGQYTIQGPTGRSFSPPPGRFWRVSEERLRDLDADGRVWWGPNGLRQPREVIAATAQGQGGGPIQAVVWRIQRRFYSIRWFPTLAVAGKRHKHPERGAMWRERIKLGEKTLNRNWSCRTVPQS